MKKYHGFTLIELIMTIVLIGILSVVLSKILVAGYKTITTSQQLSETSSQAYLALAKLVDDTQGANTVVSSTATGMTILSKSGSTNTYLCTGTSLTRNSQLLASGVTACNFAYMTATGVATTTASAVRYVSLSFTLTQGDISASYNTMAGIRGII